jgi:hypothetical protein
MSTQQAALENLRVIRSLMEKAHIYRAISAPAALVGGVLAIALGGYGAYTGFSLKTPMEPMTFLIAWHAVLLIAGVMNVVLLAKEAGLRGQPLISDGMRMAMRAISPPLIVGGVIGAGMILAFHNLTMAALTWTVCYGLALLATASFSPRSLIRLGRLFVAGGLVLFIIWAAVPDIRLLPTDEGPASLIMAVTFGFLHLFYGIAVLIRTKPEPLTAE